MSLPARIEPDLTPAILDQLEAQAREAIENVTDPDEAEVLLRKVKVAEDAARLAKIGGERAQRWAGLKLLAERRYGELLGPDTEQPRDERGRVSSTNAEPLSGADRFARHQARNVAAVPEPTFNEYVEATDKPSRAGLMAVHYSSATDEWATPQDFFDRLASEFDFELDVCALPSSAKCERFFSPEDNGLEQDWTGVCWMNPPYGNEIAEWVRKAYESAEAGATVVCLVPARVDTGWWWDYCRYGEIRFLRGRLKFGGAETSAPFPSAVVVFGREPNALAAHWEWK